MRSEYPASLDVALRDRRVLLLDLAGVDVARRRQAPRPSRSTSSRCTCRARGRASRRSAKTRNSRKRPSTVPVSICGDVERRPRLLGEPREQLRRRRRVRRGVGVDLVGMHVGHRRPFYPRSTDDRVASVREAHPALAAAVVVRRPDDERRLGAADVDSAPRLPGRLRARRGRTGCSPTPSRSSSPRCARGRPSCRAAAP